MKANRLKKGDTIGVVAASDPITEAEKAEIRMAVNRAEELGLKVKFGKHAFCNPTGYGETAIHKAEDLNEMFGCKDVKGIFCGIRWI